VCSALSWLGRLVAAEARVRSQASKCQICGGQKCYWDSFFLPVLIFFFTVIIITAVLDTDFEHVHLTRRTVGRTDKGWEPSKREGFFGNRGVLNTKHLTFREYLCSVEGTRKMLWRMGPVFCCL
jgi:hypothetical protein